MKSKILIVEDQFIEANNLKLILLKAGYLVCSFARSVPEAIKIIKEEKPDLILLDIFLDGPETGIDLAMILKDRKIPFVFLSANSNKQTLDAAKATNPYGFLVKPFRERDVLVMLDIALFATEQKSINITGLLKKQSTQNVEDDFKLIKGESKALKNILEQVDVVAKSDVSVLVLGESGTGKELIAQCIHKKGNQRHEV